MMRIDLVSRVLRSERGVTAAEYGVLAAGIASPHPRGVPSRAMRGPVSANVLFCSCRGAQALAWRCAQHDARSALEHDRSSRTDGVL